MKEFCILVLDNLILAGICLSLFLGAYLGYLLLFFLLRKFFPAKKSLAGEIIYHLRYPVLAFLLEIVAFVSIGILLLQGEWYAVLTHLLVIFFIATIGWALIALAYALESYLNEKKEILSLDDMDKRSFITRTHICYRAFVCLIVICTFGSILMTFPAIKNVGIGILGSAGIAGIALGIAARPILLNLMAGFQIAFTKMLKIGDAVVVEGEMGNVEEIFLTHVIIKTSDLRRLLLPISYFIDKPFQNWSALSTELIGSVFLHCDFSAPMPIIREKFNEILQETPLWNKKVASVDVTDLTSQSMEIRLTMSANNSGDSFNLRCYVREKMIEFLHKTYPDALPKVTWVR